VLVIRYSLKMLLCYQGWMFEPRGRMSIKTKLWALCTKILGGTNPKLYSYQASLPRMPVPPLKSTIERYLTSVRPLLDDKDYDAMKSLSEEFLSTIASKLQRYLVLKSWWATNYVSDWWEQYVYLAGRGPIMVNSNYYGMDLLYHVPTNIQTSRAANVVHALFAFRSTLDKEMIKPVMNGVVPLCSSQYERVFNTCRTPGVESGTSATGWTVGTFAVYHQGRWFKMTCYKNGILLEPSELEIQLESIINNTSEPSEGEKHLAALTAGERVPWAKARNTYFADGINKKSLHAIEKISVRAHIGRPGTNNKTPSSPGLSSYGRALLHGKCHNRWFDKSFNCVVFKNGRFGINAEHSWADAPIMSYLAEQVLGYEYQSLGYGPDDKSVCILIMYFWARINFYGNMPLDILEVIESSLLVAQNLADDVHLRVSAFKHFGKGLVKTFKMSPDAFIQAALQIAHLRDKGHFSLTYEASMTRLFREGRTETVRSCTNEMCAFARSMNDENATKEERYALLKKAVDRHIDAYKEAMTGQGIDRHLFCLYVVSKYLKLESPFLAKVLRLPWRLSTSQTPHQQAMNIDLNKHPNFLSGGGGFGPVADDGYGVSYIICHEDLIMFHVSSKHSSPET
uniref:Choline/carnitine acyltransferase domain-containing protein n=1 Tax=Ciona savignyi TaxID=51511 RepID=H2YB11_CIOSA